MPTSSKQPTTTDAPPPAPRSRWSGLSPDERRSQRRVLLLDTAFDLLGTEGWSATTVRAVVERSRLNARYFYESFADLDELIVAVYDRVVEELGAEVIAALDAAPDSPATQVHEVIRRIVEFVDEDRRRGRVLFAEGLGNAALNRRRMEAGLGVIAFIERSAAERHGEAARTDPLRRLGAAILVGGLNAMLFDWLEGRIPISRKRLVDDATALFLALGDATAGLAAARSGGTA